MGERIKDNFKRRFGDPVRIKIEYAKDKISPFEDEYRSEQISKAHAGVLKGILGREPTLAEVKGNKKIIVSRKFKENKK